MIAAKTAANRLTRWRWRQSSANPSLAEIPVIVFLWAPIRHFPSGLWRLNPRVSAAFGEFVQPMKTGHEQRNTRSVSGSEMRRITRVTLTHHASRLRPEFRYLRPPFI